MTFDELQRTWQSQESGFRLSIDSEMLLREVRGNKKHFRVAVFWRDVREVGVSLVMFMFFLYCGFKYEVWSFFLLSVLVLGVGVFMIADRVIRKAKQPQAAESLLGCIEGSLNDVVHQIWLLKHVLWWYILPPCIGIVVFLGHVAWLVRGFWPTGLTRLLVTFIFCVLVNWGIYWLNQRAVRKVLGPRKQELDQLLNSLRNASP